MKVMIWLKNVYIFRHWVQADSKFLSFGPLDLELKTDDIEAHFDYDQIASINHCMPYKVIWKDSRDVRKEIQKGFLDGRMELDYTYWCDDCPHYYHHPDHYGGEPWCSEYKVGILERLAQECIDKKEEASN